MTKKEIHEIVEGFGEKISRLSHRMILDSELAKEAAQEVWFEILRNIGGFKGDSGISTWIYTVAKRTILRYAKTERILKAHEFELHFSLDQIEYDDAAENRKQWAKEKCDYCLTAFCHCLTNEARLIFLFRNLAEISDSQIAEVMELNEQNVRKIASRSKEKVRSFMLKDCMLVNTKGNCRCRIRKHIQAVQLDDEYKKLAKGVRLVDLYRKFDKELPRKNYWERNVL